MTFALSTNWCARRLTEAAEIVDKAQELGFGALELGFHTTDAQAAGFRSHLGRLSIGSVHAFCPVPLSAPQGYPELYALASFDEEARKMARFQILKNVRFAAELGADAVVLHLGRVFFRGFLKRRDFVRRVKRGTKMTEIAKRALAELVPELEKCRVTLGLENLPYLEGFPAEWEVADLCGDWVRPWFDTGHDFVRAENGWKTPPPKLKVSCANVPKPLGLHVNDSNGGDDHLAPGTGKIDFAALKPLAVSARHLVLEPNEEVTEQELAAGLSHIRRLWSEETPS